MRRLLLLIGCGFVVLALTLSAVVLNPAGDSPAASGASALTILAAANAGGGQQQGGSVCGAPGKAGPGPSVAAMAAKRAGFTGSNLVMAVAVAGAESGWNPNATNNNTNGSTDYGLWQINSVHAALLAAGNWRNPYDNAAMAYRVWHDAGGSWRPWVTWQHGSQMRFMAQAQAAVAGSGVASVQPCSFDGSGRWRQPLSKRDYPYFISSPFGPRNMGDGTHSGTDLAAPCGTPIYAAAAGKVTVATMFPPGSHGLESYGNVVMIDHVGGVETRYGHQSVLLVRAGQQVAVGQRIGSVGNTGHSFGCHLHFQIDVNGVETDPVPFMAARGAPLR